jgi:hypothetical protein
VAEPEKLEIETLLEQLSKQGCFHSQGQFSVDTTFLRQKLSAYRLTNPWLYLAFAVRAGVAGGAPSIYIDNESQFSYTTVHLPIPPLQPGALLRLGKSTLVDPKDRVLSLLALAFEAAMALKGGARTVEIRTGSPGQMGTFLRADTRRGEIQIGQVEWTHEQAGVHFSVQIPWWKMFWNAFLEGWHTANSFDHIGVPLSWDKEIRNAPVGLQELQVTSTGSVTASRKAPEPHPILVVAGRQWDAGQIPYGGGTLQPPQWVAARPGEELQPASQDFAEVPWLQVEGEPALGAWAILQDGLDLTWILHGVVLQTESWPESIQEDVDNLLTRHSLSLGALVVADGLQLDLSGQKLVHDEAYQERLNWIHSLVKCYQRQLNRD